MNGSRKRRSMLRPILMVVMFAVPMIAVAEKGRFQGHAVLNNTKFNEFKAPEGHPYKAAWSGEQEGLIFHNGGGGRLDRMLDRAHYIVQFVGDAGTISGYCMKTFTHRRREQAVRALRLER